MMMISTIANTVNGNPATSCEVVVSTRLTGTNPFERLIQISRENERLLERLEFLGTRLDRARAYADAPCANRSLATVLVDHARCEYAEALAQVRANRAEALGILRACGRIGFSKTH